VHIRSLPIVKGIFFSLCLAFYFSFYSGPSVVSCPFLQVAANSLSCPVLQNSFSALACFSYSIRHAHLISFIHSFISTHFEPRPLSRLRLSDYKFSGLHVFPDIWHCALTKLPVPWIHSHDASRGPGWPLHVLAVNLDPSLIPSNHSKSLSGQTQLTSLSWLYNGPLAPHASTSPSVRSFCFSYFYFRGFL